MDALNDPAVHTVVVMSSTQIGKTETILNVLGYYAEQDPSPILVMQPTLEMAEAFSKDRLAPMIRDTPSLAAVFPDPKARDSGNTLLHKRFPGGHITIIGANSPSSLASRPIRIVLADEIDRYPISTGTEGDPVNLAKKRTSNFYNRKLLLTSTPTIKGASRVEWAYSDSDQRRYLAPCPACGHEQHLRWSQIDFSTHGTKDAPVYICEHCETPISERHKIRMLSAGRWVATEPFDGVAGFHLNELYSPWRRWAEIVTDFLAAKDSPEQLQVWVNTSLGETWEDQGDRADSSDILSRREDYAADAPAGTILITAAVDVQDDRLEVYMYGWAQGEECWAIDAATLYGNPGQPQLWADLDDLLQTEYRHESGAQMPIVATCIDSGGHFTQMVYDFCKTRQARRIFATKGIAGEGRALVSAPSQKQSGKDRRKTPLFTIGVDDAKGLLMSRLKVTSPGPGYIHIPAGHSLFGDEYAAQLTAEKRVTKYRRGFPCREWQKTRPRNEALDCWILALAALRIANPRWAAIKAPIYQPRRPPPRINSVQNKTFVTKNRGAPWIK